MASAFVAAIFEARLFPSILFCHPPRWFGPVTTAGFLGNGVPLSLWRCYGASMRPRIREPNMSDSTGKSFRPLSEEIVDGGRSGTIRAFPHDHEDELLEGS